MDMSMVLMIICLIMISWFTITGYDSGLRGGWLIGYVALRAVIAFVVVAAVIGTGLIWLVGFLLAGTCFFSAGA